MIDPRPRRCMYGNDVLAAEVHRPQVHVLHALPHLGGGGEDRVVVGRRDARVVKRHVDRTVASRTRWRTRPPRRLLKRHRRARTGRRPAAAAACTGRLRRCRRRPRARPRRRDGGRRASPIPLPAPVITATRSRNRSHAPIRTHHTPERVRLLPLQTPCEGTPACGGERSETLAGERTAASRVSRLAVSERMIRSERPRANGRAAGSDDYPGTEWCMGPGGRRPSTSRKS